MKITNVSTSYLAIASWASSSAKQPGPRRRPTNKEPPELLIIADRTTPYRLLVEVMFSAKQKEAGYKRFRLIVQKQLPERPETDLIRA